jgi:hypothetical protein
MVLRDKQFVNSWMSIHDKLCMVLNVIHDCKGSYFFNPLLWATLPSIFWSVCNDMVH